VRSSPRLLLLAARAVSGALRGEGANANELLLRGSAHGGASPAVSEAHIAPQSLGACLDWLLSDVGAEELAAASAQALCGDERVAPPPQRAFAPPRPPSPRAPAAEPHGALAWRCLDRSHGHGCTECVPRRRQAAACESDMCPSAPNCAKPPR
jgi:hypothetical protein